MKNAFEFFSLTPSLAIDAKELRAKYLEIQRNVHPDFGSDVSTDSEIANTYFEVLKNSEKRLKLLLELYSNIDLNQNVLPSDFLMEMMDLNDVIEESHLGNETSKIEAESILNSMKTELDNQLLDYLKDWEMNQISIDEFSQWKEYVIWFQKFKYWSRLRKNLDGIEEI